MKKHVALIALCGLFAAGCASTDHYGASDDAEYTTPSWGTSSNTDRSSAPKTRAPDGMGGSEIDSIFPSAGYDRWADPKVPPTQSSRYFLK